MNRFYAATDEQTFLEDQQISFLNGIFTAISIKFKMYVSQPIPLQLSACIPGQCKASLQDGSDLCTSSLRPGTKYFCTPSSSDHSLPTDKQDASGGVASDTLFPKLDRPL